MTEQTTAGTLPPDMGPPLLILDVDGALAPLRRPQGIMDRTWHDATPVENAGGFRLVLSRALGDAIASLPTHRRVWCTTWRGRANDVVCRHLGWAPLDVLEVPTSASEERSGSHAWKFRAVARYIEELQPPPSAVAWVDDEFHDPAGTGRGVGELARLVQSRREDGWLDHVGLLLLGPDPYTGLTPSDLEKLDAFLREHQGEV